MKPLRNITRPVMTHVKTPPPIPIILSTIGERTLEATPTTILVKIHHRRALEPGLRNTQRNTKKQSNGSYTRHNYN